MTSSLLPLKGPDFSIFKVDMAAAKRPASSMLAPDTRWYKYPMVYVSPHPVASTTSLGLYAGMR